MKLLRGSLFLILLRPVGIPHSSRCAGSIRNDISLWKVRGKKWRFATLVQFFKGSICESPLLPPNNQLLAMSFRATARNLMYKGLKLIILLSFFAALVLKSLRPIPSLTRCAVNGFVFYFS